MTQTTPNTIQQPQNKDAAPTSRPAAYTIDEAAVELRMSTKSVRRQIDRGNLRKCKVFGKILIPRKDIESFFERHSAYAFDA